MSVIKMCLQSLKVVRMSQKTEYRIQIALTSEFWILTIDSLQDTGNVRVLKDRWRSRGRFRPVFEDESIVALIVVVIYKF